MSKRLWRFTIHALLALVLCPLAAAGSAQAADLLGFYIGGAFGQAHVRVQPGRFPGGSGSPFPLPAFDATHSAYQAMLGIRALSFLGAEITYVDLGRPSAGTAARASQKGEAAYALLYLPVPVIDVYVKAGVSRMTTDIDATYLLPGVALCQIGHPDCGVVNVRGSSTDTSFAYGAGVQWRLGDWAVRGEYERFEAAGATPTLLAVGMTYWIP